MLKINKHKYWASLCQFLHRKCASFHRPNFLFLFFFLFVKQNLTPVDTFGHNRHLILRLIKTMFASIWKPKLAVTNLIRTYFVTGEYVNPCFPRHLLGSSVLLCFFKSAESAGFSSLASSSSLFVGNISLNVDHWWLLEAGQNIRYTSRSLWREKNWGGGLVGRFHADNSSPPTFQ